MTEPEHGRKIPWKDQEEMLRRTMEVSLTAAAALRRCGFAAGTSGACSRPAHRLLYGKPRQQMGFKAFAQLPGDDSGAILIHALRRCGDADCRDHLGTAQQGRGYAGDARFIFLN